ncbi:MAG: thiolase family protein [Gammaproteobacteria bacterium]|nr:thiolase family protein [Gammaproteobacteria bacterium]
MDLNDVVVLSGVRLPIGKFGGSLRDYRVYELGALAIAEAVRRAGLAPDEVDEVFVACNRQSGNGPNPGRSAAVLAGVPATVPAHTINMACPAGLRAVIEAAQAMQLDECSTAVVCGMESMSTIPHILTDARWVPARSGDIVIRDEFFSMVEPLSGMRPTELAEHTAAKYGISRAEQEQFAWESHQKAARAWTEGWSAAEVAPVEVRSTPATAKEMLTADECIRANVTLERMGQLKPVHPGGTVTAATASAVTDGAGAIILTSRRQAEHAGRRPLASVVGYLQIGVDPQDMLEGPAAAIPALLDRVGMNLDQMDVIEVNEAFAAQVIANERSLQWDRSRLNVHGGAIALGHPTGFTGVRLVLSAANALRIHGGEFAMISVCGGGGLGVAMIIRAE